MLQLVVILQYINVSNQHVYTLHLHNVILQLYLNTKYHSLGGLNNKHLFLINLKAGRSMIKVPINSVSVEPTLLFISSDQFSRSVVSDALQPHESQRAKPPCPSPSPGVRSHSCWSSRWCHPGISSSVFPFSSCPQSLQHPSLFQWVNSSHEVAKVLEFQL